MYRMLWLLAFSSVCLSSFSTTYYSASNALDGEAVSAWFDQTDDAGLNPGDFTNPLDTFIVQILDTLSTSGDWELQGTLLIDGMFVSENNLQFHGNVKGSGSLISTGQIKFVGSTNQYLSFNQPVTMRKLILDKTEQLVLESNITVNDSLVLNSGHLYNGGYQLTIDTSGVIIGSELAHVITTGSGSVVYEHIAEGDTVVVPVGPSEGLFRPLTIIGEFGTVSDAYEISVKNQIEKLFLPHQLQNDSAFVKLGWTITERISGGGNLSFSFPWLFGDGTSHVEDNQAALSIYQNDANQSLQVWGVALSDSIIIDTENNTGLLFNQASPFGHYILGVQEPTILPPPEVVDVVQQGGIVGGAIQFGVKMQYVDFKGQTTTNMTILGLPSNEVIPFSANVIDGDSVFGAVQLPCSIPTDNYSLMIEIPDYEPIVTNHLVQVVNDIGAVISGPDTVCLDGPGVVWTMEGIGGTPPYNYQWAVDGLQTTESVTITQGGSYSAGISDANQCGVAGLFFDVEEFVSTNNSLTGSVSIGGSNATSGQMELYQISAGAWKLLNIVPIAANGAYVFNDLSDGDFILLSRPDTAVHKTAIPTYSGGATTWKSATVFGINCQSTFQTDITVQTVTAITTGIGVIKGTIKDNKATKTTGDPIPGLDVVLVKIPPNSIVAATTTDENGDYQFDDLPNGDYEVQVQLPGADQLTTWEISLSDEYNSATGIDYLVDTTGSVTKTQFVSAAIEHLAFDPTMIYPNPVSTVLHVDGMVDQVLYHIVDLAGRNLQTGQLNKGSNVLDLVQLLPGMYFLTAGTSTVHFIKQ